MVVKSFMQIILSVSLGNNDASFFPETSVFVVKSEMKNIIGKPSKAASSSVFAVDEAPIINIHKGSVLKRFAITTARMISTTV